MKKNFPIEEIWAPYQLRPSTPLEGIPLSTLFPDMDMKERYAGFNKAGEPFGLRFGERSFLSNSRPALEASEYARDHGKFELFHDRVFHAYFTDLLDIGDTRVLFKLAQEIELDPDELKRCLDKGIYRARIEESMKDAARYGITAVPTFIINGVQRIVGAQPLESFKDKLRRIEQSEE